MGSFCILFVLTTGIFTGSRTPFGVLGAGKNCLKECKDGLGHLERMMKGKYTCQELDDGGYKVVDPCQMKCSGEKEAEDKTQCFCDFCKQKEQGAHSNFCEVPGKGKHLKEDDCDKLVCTGKAKFYGKFCKSGEDVKFMEEKKKSDCLKKCKGDNNLGFGERLRDGKYVCAEDGDEAATIHDPCKKICDGGGPDAPDQTKCFCNYCKQWPIAHERFCTTKGADKFIQESQCDELVCTGKAKYYGAFCKFDEATAMAKFKKD